MAFLAYFLLFWHALSLPEVAVWGIFEGPGLGWGPFRGYMKGLSLFWGLSRHISGLSGLFWVNLGLFRGFLGLWACFRSFWVHPGGSETIPGLSRGVVPIKGGSGPISDPSRGSSRGWGLRGYFGWAILDLSRVVERLY